MIIYFDVLFLINLIMNFSVLFLVGQVCDLRFSTFNIILASFVGNTLLLEVIFPQVFILKSLVLRLVVSVLMVSTCFRPVKVQDFVKTLSFFYLVSFMVGGGALAFFHLINIDRLSVTNIVSANSISLPWWILLASSIILLLFFKFLWPHIYSKLTKEKLFTYVTVFFGKERVKFQTLIDTGNDLFDPITNAPVIIVEFDVMKGLFSEEFYKVLKDAVEGDITSLDLTPLKSNYYGTLRLIPYKSIGKNHGIMVGFKPDYITISYDNKIIRNDDVVVGIHGAQLSSDNSYRALLNPNLLGSQL